MQNYTGYGWEGKNYNRDLDIKEIAKRVRKQLKATFPACKFSVTIKRYSMGRSMSVVLMQGPFDKESQECKDTLKTAEKIAESYRFDDSDSGIDYFRTNFYLDVFAGRWNAPFNNTQA